MYFLPVVGLLCHSATIPFCVGSLTFYRYLRALAAMYIRMTFRGLEVYELLEPLLKDYRKLCRLSTSEFQPPTSAEL